MSGKLTAPHGSTLSSVKMQRLLDVQRKVGTPWESSRIEGVRDLVALLIDEEQQRLDVLRQGRAALDGKEG